MIKNNCKLICNGGYWIVELPFAAGTIELGDSMNEVVDMSDELKIINHLENGLSPEEMVEEDVHLTREEICEKIKQMEKTWEAKNER